MAKGIDHKLLALKHDGKLWGAIYCLGQWEAVSTKLLDECNLYQSGQVEKIRAILLRKGINAKPVTYGKLLDEQRKLKERNNYIQKRKTQKYAHAKQPT